VSDNPLANILARLVGERSDVAARAFERAAYDYAMERGCDLGRDAEAYARLRVVTSAVRGGDYNEAWMLGALDALRDAIYSSRSRAEELRRRVDDARRSMAPVAVVFIDDPRSDEAPSPDIVARTMEYANGIGLRFSASTEDNDDVVQIIANGRDAGYATSRGIRVPVGEWRELRPMTATQQREADARAEWRRRTIESMGAYAWKLCGSCGRQTRRSVLCFRCRGDAPAALARWRDWITQRQRHAAPVPLDVLGGVCASRLYPEAPRAHDAVRLRCPLRRSPDRGVTLCVAQPTTDCVTPTWREA
jgi:hypothetical protein